LRALAVTSAKRSPAAPALPTIAEAGIPGYETGEWWGVLAPGRTPTEIIDRLNREFITAINEPRAKQRFAELGADIVAGSPQQFDQFIRQQMKKWGEVIRRAGIQPF
jgi:tripartite-type tricarboxylate transporter receptor subunit TctC